MFILDIQKIFDILNIGYDFTTLIMPKTRRKNLKKCSAEKRMKINKME
ncbi:MAG: hypothetical protein LBI29_00460 [Rickettsiales bacterium]|nr:hypothetical protein [Rickettsiales bacterium]